MRKLGKEKKIGMIAAQVCPDYIHMGIPSYLSVAQFIGFSQEKK